MKNINIEMEFDNSRKDYAFFAAYQILDKLSDGYSVKFYFITRNVSDFSIMDKFKDKFGNKLNGFENADLDRYLKTTDKCVIPYENTQNGNWTDIVLSRLYVADMWKNLDRAIHIDDDILVLGSISELWDYDDDAKLIGCYANVPRIYANNPNSNNPLINMLTYNPFIKKSHLNFYVDFDVKEYFNAGVYLIDLQYYRESDMLNKAYDLYMKNHNKYSAMRAIPDETLLNILYKDIVKYTSDNRFNFENKLSTGDCGKSFGKDIRIGSTKVAANNDICIVHFLDYDDKPWRYMDSRSRYNREWYLKYSDYLQEINQE